MPLFPWPLRVGLRLGWIVRPGHLRIAYLRITDDLHLGWRCGDTDFFKEISSIPGHRRFFVHPIFVVFKAEQKGSSISFRSAVTAVDQARCCLQDGLHLQRVVTADCPLKGAISEREGP